MKMVRLSVLPLVVVCFSVALLAQSPPQITNTLFDFETVENERVSILVRLSDPDPDETLTVTFSLVNGAALGISESQLQFGFKSRTFNGSTVNISNEFSVPSGTVGATIEIQVDVTDKDNLTASRVFRYRVVGTNEPPVISLSVSQPGSDAAGTQADPFRYGSLQLSLTIQDDGGVDDYTYGLQIISGTLCVNYPFFWFGREGLTPTVDVPKVATLMALSASATVIDGIHTVTVHRTVWVAPEPEGCSVANQPPVISLSVRQPGYNAAGTETDPFRAGTLEYMLSIQDDFGVDDHSYGLEIISGSLCENSPFFWYGREGLAPTVDVPPVATLMALDAWATVVDGEFTETVHRMVWVRPEPEGCPSGPDPLDSVTAVASPNPVSEGGLIRLKGGMTGNTSPYSAVWYLSSTSGEELIANSWRAQYRAPGFATGLKFKFKVEEIAGTKESVKTVPVIVSSTPPPPLPPPPDCACAGVGLPPGVSATSDSLVVLGGHTVGLTGVASDPNYPPGSPGPVPTVLWKVEDSGGIPGLNIIGATHRVGWLSTPVVEADQWILLSLNAKNQSNGCECLDYLQLLVLAEESSGGGGGGPPANVGTQECREVQFQAQEAVLLGGPYKNNAELVKTASDVVDLYKKNGEISNKCSSCILQEFRRRIPIEEQGACGWLCPCLDLPGWVSLLETEEWTVCDLSDPAWDPLAALRSDSYLLWAGFQIDAPGRPGFDACASMDLVEYQFLDLLFPITERDRNECMDVILDKAGELDLICE